MLSADTKKGRKRILKGGVKNRSHFRVKGRANRMQRYVAIVNESEGERKAETACLLESRVEGGIPAAAGRSRRAHRGRQAPDTRDKQQRERDVGKRGGVTH